MASNEDDSGFDIGRSFESFQKVIKQSGPAAAASYGLIVSILLFTCHLLNTIYFTQLDGSR